MPVRLAMREVCSVHIPHAHKVHLTNLPIFIDFAVFHQDALNNATSVLQAQGKILGTNVAPFSVQGFLTF
jgi:hypothetical protein